MKRNKLSLTLIYVMTVFVLIFMIFAGNRAATVFSENLPVDRVHCIIIDAGHGGEDGGATSCTGKLESEYNLEISMRLNDLFHFLGYDTYMIRTSDVSIYTNGETIAQKKISDLKERVRICNNREGAVLLSIHQNTFSDSQYSGAQVFYPTTEGSNQLARQLQDAIKNTINPGSNRKIKKAEGIYLMEHIQCTGVLIECGFLSNPEEESNLRSDAYQKLLCCTIAATVSNFLDG